MAEKTVPGTFALTKNNNHKLHEPTRTEWRKNAPRIQKPPPEGGVFAFPADVVKPKGFTVP
jgi:hypothetical protein